MLDSVVGVGMVDEFNDTLNVTKTTNKQADGTRKRVHTKISDSSTSDEESMTKKSSNTSTDNWPRFLIIEPVSEGALNSLSPFAIHKALQGLAGELNNVTRI